MNRVILYFLILVALVEGESSRFSITSLYSSATCGGSPRRIDVKVAESSSSGCGSAYKGWKSADFTSTDDYKKAVWVSFGGNPLLLLKALESDCETVAAATAFPASGTCEQILSAKERELAIYMIAKREAGNAASVRYFKDSACTSPLLEPVQLTKSITTQDATINLNSSSCDDKLLVWEYFDLNNPYIADGSSSSSGSNSSSASSSLDTGGNDDADSSMGILAGVLGGVLGSVLVALVIVLYRRRSRSKGSGQEELRQSTKNKSAYHDHNSPGSEKRTSSPDTSNTASIEDAQPPLSGLWTDDAITTKRIFRRKVKVKQLLSRGAFGEVYTGSYLGEVVAVKMLSAESRSVLSHVNNFLAEAKITATMYHPRIVHFIGVAWNSLSDLCVVMEYMEGGDLRTLLNGFEMRKHPVGIDREKATIALHVCHALTYLHSLSPPVIHRDLKSRNILLNSAMGAKLTDFGISRERLDSTLTTGVGTLLWMAPEVMLGEWYDDKADIFSFGVVLSELDLHTLPYGQAKDHNRDSKGRRLPDTILLQQVAMGHLTVEFSDAAPKAIVELGKECVSVDPSLRPTAAEVLYRLQIVLASELK